MNRFTSAEQDSAQTIYTHRSEHCFSSASAGAHRTVIYKEFFMRALGC